MAKRIFRAVCLISLWVFAASVVIIMWVLYDYYSETQRTQLKRQTEQVAEGVELCGMEYLIRLSAEAYRLTKTEKKWHRRLKRATEKAHAFPKF